ncbi:GMC family oxidoreductase [Chryseolinea sp. T2]|uniref:GMC family oxidoreductase n=1 Tax=Chryseolinea sp. T2 TaxID=3129255 RepID=UPI003077872C
MYLQGKAKESNTYDAIVIGSGITGGWAAKEFCEHGLKTLVIERGRPVKHLKDYPTATMNPWDFKNRGALTREEQDANPIAKRCYAFDDATKHFFVKDDEHPYVQEKPFDWIRGYQEGGKSLIWARQTQRWSHFDFEAPERDGFAVPWPVTYQEMAPWYSHVEKFVGIAGNRDGLETLPDCESLPAFEMNCVEKHVSEQIRKNYNDRFPVIGRCAHLTQPQEVHLQQGRGKCQARELCYRGCPYGGYFSSNSATLPWAAKTGNLTMRTDAMVHSILYDEAKKKASGVKVIDANTKEETDYFARVIFVNGACLNSNLLLLNSKSSRFPDGFGNDNGLLGKYVAFHNYRGNITATIDGFKDTYYEGRRPAAIMMPSFRNVHKQEMDFLRGYMVFYSASRGGWSRGSDQIGAALKEEVSQPGGWSIFMMMQGETIPKASNKVYLSPDKKDAWGIPLLVTDIDYDENDLKSLHDFLEQGSDMLDKSGCRNIVSYDTKQAPGLDIHEMGGVRMGRDPKTSLLNKWNQFHNCPNVFVTDGAAMVSTSSQNPSLTFMAFTARAANHAVEEMKKQNL